MEVTTVPLLRRVPAAAVSVVVLVAGLVTTSATASAELPDPPRSPCSNTLSTTRYLVLFDEQTQRRDAADEISTACGELTVYYPQISVAVATSADTGFTSRLGPGRAFSAQRALGFPDEQGGHRKADETDAVGAPVTTAPVATTDRTGEQWDMTMIGADRARTINPGSHDVVVGVLDSGVDPNHPELADALAPNLSAGCLSGKADPSRDAWMPTRSPHGTHVAGTVAAADDGTGITGVAPGVRVASVKVVDDDGLILPEYAVCGLMWASENGMTVTNNSYFVDPWLMTCDRDSERVVYEAVRRAVDHATERGVLTVAAATNMGTDLTVPNGQTTSAATTSSDSLAMAPESRTLDSTCSVLPAGLRDVVAVSATRQDKLKAGYSSYGLGEIDLAAPGGEQVTPPVTTQAPAETSADAPHQPAAEPAADGRQGCVLSTVPNGYDKYCGTSMATPHVTGVAALLASEHPDSSPRDLSAMLTEQAEPIPCPADYDLNDTGTQDAYCSGYTPYNGFYGHGMVDALAAVTR